MITLTLPLPPQTKKRARTGRHGGYYDTKYTQWKRDAEMELRRLWGNRATLEWVESIHTVHYADTLACGDVEGLHGAVMDALVKAGVLKDDGVSQVKKGSFDFDLCELDEEPQIVITITPGIGVNPLLEKRDRLKKEKAARARLLAKQAKVGAA